MNQPGHPIRRTRAAAIAVTAAPVPAIPSLLDDLKFFAVVWACGLVFFGTWFA